MIPILLVNFAYDEFCICWDLERSVGLHIDFVASALYTFSEIKFHKAPIMLRVGPALS